MQVPDDLFTLQLPTVQSVPIVANLPHSGLQVPVEIAASLTPQLLSSLPHSDWHLQALYRFLPALGITMLQANYSRYVVDLNRALKPPLLGSFWSAVVPAQTAFGQPIYHGHKPSRASVQARIEAYYLPYHQKLAEVLNEAIAQHGKVMLLDLHSFMGLLDADVCLGNANGQTCSADVIDQVAEGFAQQGYRVVKNKVFSGGYITRHYGQYPAVEALQIELRYPCYLPNEQIEACQLNTKTPVGIPQWQGEAFEQAQEKLKRLLGAIARQAQAR